MSHAETMHALLDHWGWALPRSDDRWSTVRCGIHDDRHGSARVHMEEGAYTCLACGAHAGSPLGLVKAVEGLEGPPAHQFLASLGVSADSGERAVNGPRRPWKGLRRREGRVSGWREAKA